MKPKSYQLAIAIAFGILVCSFSTSKRVAPAPSRHADNTYYYFYDADTDTFQRYSNTSTEIVALQTIYGVPVDQNSFGGTEVALGYSNNIVPHQVWPSVLLYAHF
jgi:hypothetical protein